MAIMNWTSQRAAQLQLEQEKPSRDSLTNTIMKVASSVTSSGSKEKEAPLLSALSDLFEEIQAQKRQTGTVKPHYFISTLKKQNSTPSEVNKTLPKKNLCCISYSSSN
jgi:hypothetical protein